MNAADPQPTGSPQLASNRPFQRAAVLGAGVMGARIAAHLANAGLAVDLLDLGDRAAAGLKAAAESKPAPFYVPDHAQRIRTGSLEADLARLAEADWVVEAIIEDLSAKRHLLTTIVPFLKPDAPLTTNTSGLPVAAVGAELPAGVKRRWFGTHFFNPPRYMRLLEAIPGPETDQAVMARLLAFVDQRLGKGVVRAKDTPNFIANRIGTFSLMRTLQLMAEMGLTVEQVDALTGPVLGWPKSATFRTADLVGLDLLAHVVANAYENLPHDEAREIFRLPDYLQEMIQRGWLGDKSGQGFYKKGERNAQGEREILALDLASLQYRPRQKARFPALELAKTREDLPSRLQEVLRSPDAAGQFLWRLLSSVWRYTAARIPEIADEPWQIDQAMRWGFNWTLGPFELWEAAGFDAVAERMEKEGEALPAWAQARRAAGAAAPPPADPPGVLRLDVIRKANGVVQQNAGASLLDLGDGVGCIEFHSKMNAIGEDILRLTTAALTARDSPFEAWVIANEGENFSVGANLLLLLMAIQEDDWDEVDLAVRAFQGMTQAIRHSPRPVIAAPFQMALGGGCEVMLHAAEVVAAAETYCGLVEVGVGLIPAGGGSAAMGRRAIVSAEALRAAGPGSESLPRQEAIRAVFETMARAKVATSAEEARRLGFLRPGDVIVPNRDRLIAVAKAEARRMAEEGYAPPGPAAVAAPGPNVRATLEMGAYLMRQAEYITDYEQHLAGKLAAVLCGGDAPAGAPLPEQRWLELERETFLSLCGEAKTQERMRHTLQTGKPLRN
jgi:3-hydroxyacyl-CoA dehydrogenase